MSGFERSKTGRAKKWEFIYSESYNLDGSYVYLKEGEIYYIIYNKEKEETYFDKNSKILTRFGNDTLFSKYKKAKGTLTRENYIKSKSPVITGKNKVITRYFARYNLDISKIIFETDEMNFNLAGDFYDKVSLPWRIKGEMVTIARDNKVAAIQGERTLKGLRSILSNPFEFYISEMKPDDVMQSKLQRLLRRDHPGKKVQGGKKRGGLTTISATSPSSQTTTRTTTRTTSSTGRPGY